MSLSKVATRHSLSRFFARGSPTEQRDLRAKQKYERIRVCCSVPSEASLPKSDNEQCTVIRSTSLRDAHTRLFTLPFMRTKFVQNVVVCTMRKY